ncbi:YidB family protein [Mesorhizobium sp. IMUNJ 23232]|uniref:YidB family protein n=1 Tax=Mesorhizobium sp. IMUNJ 23232 TaxID=3376064 RepID=UPI00378BE705
MANMLGKVLLAALGVILYKNRDRIADAWNPKAGDPNNPGQAESILGGGGLKDIIDRFRNAGMGEKVDTWVSKGTNAPLDPAHVEAAIDEDTLAALYVQTGLSREEILRRLAVNLPEAVDELSPDGKLPEAKAATAEPTLLDPVPPAAQQKPSEHGQRVDKNLETGLGPSPRTYQV